MPGAHKACFCLYFANSTNLFICLFVYKLYLCFWMERHLSQGSLCWDEHVAVMNGRTMS